jgi:hypothetical protein
MGPKIDMWLLELGMAERSICPRRGVQNTNTTFLIANGYESILYISLTSFPKGR